MSTRILFRNFNETRRNDSDGRRVSFAQQMQVQNLPVRATTLECDPVTERGRNRSVPDEDSQIIPEITPQLAPLGKTPVTQQTVHAIPGKKSAMCLSLLLDGFGRISHAPVVKDLAYLDIGFREFEICLIEIPKAKNNGRRNDTGDIANTTEGINVRRKEIAAGGSDLNYRALVPHHLQDEDFSFSHVRLCRSGNGEGFETYAKKGVVMKVMKPDRNAFF